LYAIFFGKWCTTRQTPFIYHRPELRWEATNTTAEMTAKPNLNTVCQIGLMGGLRDGVTITKRISP
jgi:hypothetical protein